MANYDFVLPYSEEFDKWLLDRGYPHPIANPGSRFPTKQEVIDAILSIGTLRVERAEEKEFFAVNMESNANGVYEIRIGCSDWDSLGQSDKDSITMHGGCIGLELMLLEVLSHRCGQLLLHPDTGAPAIIVQPDMDSKGIAWLWKEACKQSNPWKYFYEKVRY
jgi:hypothetical protein